MRQESGATTPPTLHKTGQYYKKIRGKLHCFGADRQEALRRSPEHAAHLRKGAGTAPAARDAGLSLRTVCTLYLDRREAPRQIGEIGPRHFFDPKNLLKGAGGHIGVNCSICDVAALDLQHYKTITLNSWKASH